MGEVIITIGLFTIAVQLLLISWQLGRIAENLRATLTQGDSRHD